MKKLTYLISALAASLAGSAYADVSVSGSGSANYVSKATSGDKGNVHIGSAVVFGLSTTTSNGMSISTGLSVTVTSTVEAAAAAGGGQSLTFATGGATIVVGDIELGDTPGSVGGTVGMVGDAGGLDSDVSTGFTDDDGTGVSLSTSVGSATIGVGYIFDTNQNNASSTDSARGMSAFSASLPMGPMTISAGVADHDNGETSSGASASMALGGGTLTVGYSQQSLNADTAAGVTTGFTSGIGTAGSQTISAVTVTAAAPDLVTAGDSTVLGATYSMSLDADTTVSVGYQNAKDADSHSHSRMDASISRSLGGGASVYLDIRSLSGDTDQDGTDMAIGTSVSF
jgi:hypothetical protein